MFFEMFFFSGSITNMGAQAIRIQQLWDMLDAWCCKGHEAWSENIRVVVSKKLYILNSIIWNVSPSEKVMTWHSSTGLQAMYVDPRSFQLLESKFDMLEGFGHG